MSCMCTNVLIDRETLSAYLAHKILHRSDKIVGSVGSVGYFFSVPTIVSQTSRIPFRA